VRVPYHDGQISVLVCTEDRGTRSTFKSEGEWQNFMDQKAIWTSESSFVSNVGMRAQREQTRDA